MNFMMSVINKKIIMYSFVLFVCVPVSFCMHNQYFGHRRHDINPDVVECRKLLSAAEVLLRYSDNHVLWELVTCQLRVRLLRLIDTKKDRVWFDFFTVLKSVIQVGITPRERDILQWSIRNLANAPTFGVFDPHVISYISQLR